jgi:hypothetical protein
MSKKYYIEIRKVKGSNPSDPESYTFKRNTNISNVYTIQRFEREVEAEFEHWRRTCGRVPKKFVRRQEVII